MANREQRGNREKRKKKAEKSKPPAAQASPFSRVQDASTRKGSGNQKRK